MGALLPQFKQISAFGKSNQPNVSFFLVYRTETKPVKILISEKLSKYLPNSVINLNTLNKFKWMSLLFSSGSLGHKADISKPSE